MLPHTHKKNQSFSKHMKLSGAYLYNFFFFADFVRNEKKMNIMHYNIHNIKLAGSHKKKIIHFQMHGLLLPRIICLFMNLQLDSYRNIFNHIFHINFVCILYIYNTSPACTHSLYNAILVRILIHSNFN